MNGIRLNTPGSILIFCLFEEDKLIKVNNFVSSKWQRRFTKQTAASRCHPILKFENFAWSFGSKIVPESVQHVQYDYFFVIRSTLLICAAVVAVAVVIL